MYQIVSILILATDQITGYRNDPEMSKSTAIAIFKAFVEDALRIRTFQDIWKQAALMGAFLYFLFVANPTWFRIFMVLLAEAIKIGSIKRPVAKVLIKELIPKRLRDMLESDFDNSTSINC